MAFSIVQMTDLHFQQDPAAELRGVVTRETFRQVWKHFQHGLACGDWKCDELIITGDVAHDEVLATYQQLREELNEWADRPFLLPGNHDHRESLRSAFPARVSGPLADGSLRFCAIVEGWRLLGLDSHLPGEVRGELSETQLEWLRQQLEETPAGQLVAVFMHHPVLDIGAEWVDRLKLTNAADFLELIDEHACVRVVSCGHVHQESRNERNGVLFLTSPSTGVQFRNSPTLEIDSQIRPGFRVLRFDGDRLETRVVRVPLPD